MSSLFCLFANSTTINSLTIHESYLTLSAGSFLVISCLHSIGSLHFLGSWLNPRLVACLLCFGSSIVVLSWQLEAKSEVMQRALGSFHLAKIINQTNDDDDDEPKLNFSLVCHWKLHTSKLNLFGWLFVAIRPTTTTTTTTMLLLLLLLLLIPNRRPIQ